MIVISDEESSQDQRMVSNAESTWEGDGLPAIENAKFDIFSIQRELNSFDDDETITFSDSDNSELRPHNLGELYQNQEGDPEITARMFFDFD